MKEVITHLESELNNINTMSMSLSSPGAYIQGKIDILEELVQHYKNLDERIGSHDRLLSDIDSTVKSIKRSDKGFIFQIELSDDEIDKRFFMEREQIIFDKKEHGDRYKLKPSQELLLKMIDELLSQMGTD